MNYTTLIQSQVKELLGLHNCVTIPGLGSFIYRENQASANFFTHEVKVAGRTVFFNNAITADDGLLVQKIREIAGLTYSDSLKLIDTFRDELIEQLNNKRTVSFGDLGNFFINQDKHIFFLPSSGLNLDPNSYGLPVLKLSADIPKTQKKAAEIVSQPVVEEKPTPAPIQPIKQEVEEEATVISVEVDETHSKRKSNWWKIAAGIALLSLSVTGVYYGKQWISGKKNVQQAGVTIHPDSADKDNNPQSTPTTKEVPVEVPTPQTTVPEVQNIPETSNKVSEPEVIVEQPAVVEKTIPSATANGKYWVIVSMSITEELANIHSKQWQAAGFDAVVLKPENSSLYRVVLGRYDNANDAELFLNSVTTIPGFSPFVKKIK